MTRGLVWFHRDLRLTDNPSLRQAQEECTHLLLVYIHDTSEAMGAASLWYLQQSLQQLGQQCALNIVHGTVAQVLPQLVAQHQINQVYWQHNNEPKLQQRELQLAEQLDKQGVQYTISRDGLLPDLNKLLNQQGTPYRVFTPFYKRLCQQLLSPAPSAISERPVEYIRLSQHDSLLLSPHRWQDSLAQHQQAGEQAALQRLSQFVEQGLTDYTEQRDIPAVDASSQLSAALHFGEISVSQIHAALLPLLQQGEVNASAFLRQLIWREFARYILWHFPHTATQSMDPRFTPAFWQTDAEKLRRWQQGETGFAIIDAGMQQLWQTGTMHNRVRMLAASFLCKNLHQPWQSGAAWFWDTLVDADLANNSMGWQWVAGCGVDASPYFRIFNPITQATKFDPQQQYIQRWLPKGKRPAPMLDLGLTRQQALERYRVRVQGGKG